MSTQFPNSLNGLSVISSPRPGTLPTLHRTSSADGLWSPGSSSDDNNSPTVLNRCIWEKPSFVKKVDVFWKDVNLKQSSVSHPNFEGYVNQSNEPQEDKLGDEKDNLFDSNEQKTKQVHELNIDTPIKEDSKLLQSGLVDCPEMTFMDIMLTSSLDQKPTNELLDEKKNLYSKDSPQIENSHEKMQSEENELRNAAWFQAGIPREIALQILAEEQIGAFIVRESTTKPGCFALSLRVPKDFQSSGISHYLIMNSSKGYKIKGFTKEFSSLTSLITHHSVMPELLPCPLSLPRYRRPLPNSSDDFLDVDQDKQLLSKLQRLVADLDL